MPMVDELVDDDRQAIVGALADRRFDPDGPVVERRQAAVRGGSDRDQCDRRQVVGVASVQRRQLR